MTAKPRPSLPTEYQLKNGQTALIRQIQPDDAALLVEMYQHLSAETKRLRFHTYVQDPPDERLNREAALLSNLDPQRQVALIAVVEETDGPHAVAVARFSRVKAEDISAETAIVVRDEYQRQRLGQYMLNCLADVARSMGIEEFFAWVRPDNRGVFLLIKQAGLPLQSKTSHGETYLTVKLT